MPEGHSIHRIARQFRANFVGKVVAASSPQGRFVDGAAMLDGRTMTDARAVGKHLFLEFDHDEWLRVHLGLYGAWDFAGKITVDATLASAGGRIGQTNQRGTDPDLLNLPASLDLPDGLYGVEDSLTSIGAPRRTRLRISEGERVDEVGEAGDDTFPPEPVGAVRLRLLTDDAVADLRGPTACEVLGPLGVESVLLRLGPDPANENTPEAEDEFVRRLRRSSTQVGVLLMDQSVVAGIGNVYRAELLFRARLNPSTPGNQVSEAQARALWRDWAKLLDEGIRTGQMITMDGLDEDAYRAAMASRDDRHWVYHRTGLPCRICGTPIALAEVAGRKLYWCPDCQQ